MQLWHSLVWMIFWWCLHLEFSPGMGGIWIRPNAEGVRVFTYKNMLSFALVPFQQTWIWNPSFWDINIVMMLFFGVVAYYSYHWWTETALEWIYQRV